MGTENTDKKKVEEIKKQIQTMESIVKKFLDKKAIERLNNLKIAHKDRYLQILMILYQNILNGRINRKLKDEEFKRILEKLISTNKRKTRIKIIRT